jgi:hypothetical protein
MNSKKTIKYIGMLIALMTAVMGSFLLAGCGETVDFFLKGQVAQSSSSSSGPAAPTFWTDYGSNPLFGGSSIGVNRAYYPSVLKVGATYHIWYGDGTRTRHASSLFPDFSDITNVYPWPEITVGGSLISTALGSPYHPNVSYSASGWTINGATTTDPFLMYITPSSWDNIFVLSSPDGDNWTNLGTNTGILNSLNQAGVIYNFFVLFEGGTNWKGYSDNGGGQIQYFISSNGIDWTNQATNIIGSNYNTWESFTYGCISPRVVLSGGTYYLFYSSGTNWNDKGIGIAVSSNGMLFTKSTNNLIFSVYDGPAWRTDRTYTPSVFQDGTIWRMYYTGRVAAGGVYSVGMATKAGSLTN